MRTGKGWDRFYRTIVRIPSGRVATYSQIAAWSGAPRSARHVGYALAALTGTAHGIPWQRVLGARPRGHAAITIKDPVGAALQKHLLEQEGVELDARERISLERFGWRGPRRR